MDSENSTRPKKKGVWAHVRSTARELLAITFWVYVISKLFIFDIDIYLAKQTLPQYAWLLDYKFLIIIGILALVWIITKNKTMLFWVFYILFYPFILFLWRIPYFLIKQKSWILVFAFANALLSFFESLKYNFIMFACFLVGTVIILASMNKPILWFSVAVISVIVVMVYIRRFILIFRPSRVLRVYTNIFASFGGHATETYTLGADIKNLPIEQLGESQIEIWTNNVQSLVMFNRLALFTGKKLREYQNSGINFISYVFTIIILVIFTIFCFSLINYGLYKIDNGFYRVIGSPDFFAFFYYSFNKLFSGSIEAIIPITQISQIVSMVEIVLALILVGIFVSLLLSIRSQRHSDELNEVIEGVEQQGREMEVFIKDEYKIDSIEAAMEALEKIRSGTTSLLYKISDNLK